MVDAGDGFQQAALRGVVRQRVVDVPVEVLHAAVEVVVRGDQVGEQEAVGFAQCQLQGITEQLQARANVPAERVQDLRAGPTGDEAVENAPAVEAEDVAEHAPDADAAPSRTFCTRLRVWLRCATSVRRWRTRLRRSQNASSGTKLGCPSPN